MRFSTILVGTLAAFGLVASQAIPIQQVVQAIGEVTTLSNSLRTAIQGLNPINVLSQGSNIAQGLTEVTAGVTQVTAILSSVELPPISEPDAQAVVAALTTFAEAQRTLLEAVISQQGLLALIPLPGPISQELASLQAAVNALTSALTPLIPTPQVPSVNALLGQLTTTIQSLISIYQQLL